MKIAFTGTHSTGKSTIAKLLSEQEDFKSYTFIPELVAESCTKLNLLPPQSITDKHQFLAMQFHLLSLFDEYSKNDNGDIKNNLICDRTPLDNLIYFIVNKQKFQYTESFYNIYQKLAIESVVNTDFDIIFYLPPKINIHNDGFRDTDIEYRTLIDKKMLNEYKYMQEISHFKLVKVESITIEDRLSEIKEAINEIRKK